MWIACLPLFHAWTFIQSHLFISSSNIIRNGLPPYYCPIDVNNIVFRFFFFFITARLRKKISQVYDDVYCHSLSNTTFIVGWWGWGGLREWSGGGGCCAWSICLVKQLCIRWMSKSKGGGGRRVFTVWKINPGFCCVLLFGSHMNWFGSWLNVYTWLIHCYFIPRLG